MNYQIDFYTQYNQFYICDEYHNQDSSTDFWTENSLHERLALSEGIIAVRTQSYGHIRGEIILLDSASEETTFDKYDHVVQGGLNIKSGHLQILTCPTSSIELNLNIQPGVYRVRIYFAGMKGTDIDEDEGNDRYRIEIWPDGNAERKVLKQYNP